MENVYTSGTVAEISMREEHRMGCEKPDPDDLGTKKIAIVRNEYEQ